MVDAQHELIQKFTDVINHIPFNRILGLTLDAIAVDHLTMRFEMNKDLIGNYAQGILHGGVISAVLDMAGGTIGMLAAIKKNPEKDLTEMAALLGKASTISLHIDYIAPGKGHYFTAKAWVLHSGSKITFTRMELHNHDGVLIANASAAYRIG